MARGLLIVFRMETVIKGKWLTTVAATPTGNVILKQRQGKTDVSIIIPGEYKLAICNAIHHAKTAPGKPQ